MAEVEENMTYFMCQIGASQARGLLLTIACAAAQLNDRNIIIRERERAEEGICVKRAVPAVAGRADRNSAA